MSQQQILFPVGRLVGGSLYKPQPVTDNAGQPKRHADGTPMMSYSFGVAYRKAAPGARWEETSWGQKVKLAATEGFPNGEWQAATFAWKINDGDSQVPNKKGNKPCDNEGWPGHHVVWFSSMAVAPKLTDKHGSREGTLQYADGVERIKPGHLIEVLANVKDNKPSQSSGVYMNYEMVAHNDATTPEIALRASVDSTKVGFGGGAAPAPTPVAPPAAPAPAAPAAPLAVQPNTAMLAPPTPPAPPVGPQMTAKAGGVTYEAYRTAGWSDEQLRSNELMA